MDNPFIAFGVDMGRIKETLRYARRLLSDQGGFWGAVIGGAASVISAAISAFGGKKKKGSRELGLYYLMQQQAADQAAAEAKAQKEEDAARLKALSASPQGGSMGAPYVTVSAPQDQTKTLLPLALAGLGVWALMKKKGR